MVSCGVLRSFPRGPVVPVSAVVNRPETLSYVQSLHTVRFELRGESVRSVAPPFKGRAARAVRQREDSGTSCRALPRSHSGNERKRGVYGHTGVPEHPVRFSLPLWLRAKADIRPPFQLAQYLFQMEQPRHAESLP